MIARHGLRWNPEYNIPQNRREFDAQQPLFNHVLARAGYDTRFVGKWHCGQDKLPSDYGMDGWSLPDYGNVYACNEYKAYLDKLGIAQPRCTLDHNLFDSRLDGTTVTLDPPEPWTYMDGCGVLHGDSRAQEQFFVANRAIDELDSLDTTQPWCLVVSLWGPHHPYLPSEAFARQVDPQNIPRYPSFDEDLDKKPLRYGVHRDLRCDFRAHERWPEWSTWQTLIARAYAQGLQTDAAIGLLDDALQDRGLADNTLVVVTSDHGDALASHGAGWDKYSTYTEEVGRVPLVMRWPGQIAANQRRDELVSGLDITATLLDAAGASDSAFPLDGDSVLPLLNGQSDQWRDHLVVEHYGHSGDVSFQRIVYHGHYKHVAVWGDDDELYDLESDPFELDNLIDHPEHKKVLAALRRRLATHMLQERAARRVDYPESEMEHKLVESSARWPREERLLLYKLQRALGDIGGSTKGDVSAQQSG
ncbi:MAG: sulfatase-like hydrolase/transferase [Pseudomonadota bacterium]